MRNLKFALAAAALSLAVSSTARAQDEGAVADPNIDMEAVHNAYWAMNGGTYTDQLQNFEQEVNKVYHGDDYVSVAAERVPVDGYPMVRVTGYVDRDGTPGFNPEADQTVFQFVQTSPIAGYTMNYEFLDASGNVYYRGARAIPQSPFYLSYYYNWRTPIGVYYTSPARLAYLNSWRVGYRVSPVYLGWRGRFLTWRAGYRTRIVGLRRTYGVPRARVYVRPVVRARVVAPVRARVVVPRPAVKVKVRVR
jgi:hypothetical protein